MGLLGMFKKADPHADCGIVLDIGTAFVKALIFQVKDDHAHVLGLAAPTETVRYDRRPFDIRGVIRTAKRPAQAAEQAGFCLPKRLSALLANREGD